MEANANRSPVGWYVGSYLLRFVEKSRTDLEDPEAHFLSWENTVLVQEDDLDTAYEKLCRIANKHTTPYKGGKQGEDVQWRFVGVTELLPVYEELKDGAELMWADHNSRKLKTLQKWVRAKDEFIIQPGSKRRSVNKIPKL